MMERLLSVSPYWIATILISIFLYRKEKSLSKELIWASFRNSTQLIFLAFVLEIIFKSTMLSVSLGLSFIMTLNSSYHIVSRSKTRRFHLFKVILFSHILSIWPIAFLFSFDESKSYWSGPKILLPLLGMILGSTLSGVSIALGHFTQSFRDKKAQVISSLSMGATKEEATRQFFFGALRAGMTPQINSMLAMGIVSIPGLMAGQIISHSSAFDASVVQMKMMISISSGTILCTYISLYFLRNRYFSSTGELCLE